MNKIGWEKLRKIVEWFYEIQQQGNQTFQVCDIRTAFKLTVPSTYTRLKRFIALGIIKPVSLGCYEISQLSPEKIQEIKQKYIPQVHFTKFIITRAKDEQLRRFTRNTNHP